MTDPMTLKELLWAAPSVDAFLEAWLDAATEDTDWDGRCLSVKATFVSGFIWSARTAFRVRRPTAVDAIDGI